MEKYLSGFRNEFVSEAIAGILPQGQNSPQKLPHNLYAEQVSGTAFTTQRHENRRSWLYRLLPSAMHGDFQLLKKAPKITSPTPPDQLRWDPFPHPKGVKNFFDSLTTIACNQVLSIHLYSLNKNFPGLYYTNADGEYLVIPQEGSLQFFTEMGKMTVSPGEIAVIPRGIRFRVEVLDHKARGYIGENLGVPFRLPELGPIGSNGLANARDFLTPVAAFEDKSGDFKLLKKFAGNIWSCSIDHSPLDVVAWHGNYAPYKYDLARFNTINTVSFDHPDPSIFTVLTSPSAIQGVANCDFVIFPPRWMVAEHTFRPPWFHRNVMSEYMGLVRGAYDAKAEGFLPGGGSLHNCMIGHGPDRESFEKASSKKLQAEYYSNTLAFMLESCHILHPTHEALQAPQLQKNYKSCWHNFKKGKLP